MDLGLKDLAAVITFVATEPSLFKRAEMKFIAFFLGVVSADVLEQSMIQVTQPGGGGTGYDPDMEDPAPPAHTKGKDPVQELAEYFELQKELEQEAMDLIEAEEERKEEEAKKKKMAKMRKDALMKMRKKKAMFDAEEAMKGRRKKPRRR